MGHEAGYSLTTLLLNCSQEKHWMNLVPHSTGSISRWVQQKFRAHNFGLGLFGRQKNMAVQKSSTLMAECVFVWQGACPCTNLMYVSAVHTSFCSLTSEFWCIVVIYFSMYLLSFLISVLHSGLCRLLSLEKSALKLYFSQLAKSWTWLWTLLHWGKYIFQSMGKMSLLLDGLLINYCIDL